MRTVLVFAHECAPHHRAESTIGAQRPASFARHLPEFGWRAVVICCGREGRESAEERDLRGIAEEAEERLGAAPAGASLVLPTPSLRWDGRLDRWWRRSARGGGGGPVWPLLRRPLTAAKFATGDWSQSWQPCARAAAEGVLRATPVHACIGEHSPDAGLFLGRWLHAVKGIPWVADFRDPVLDPFGPLGRALYGRVARSLVSTAAATVNVHPAWAEEDRRTLGRPAHCVPNGFEPGEHAAPAPPAPGPAVAAFFGSVRPWHRLDLVMDGLLDAGPGVRLLYRGDASARVLAEARRAGVADRVDAAAAVPRGEALALMSSADLLLLLSRPPAAAGGRAEEWYPAKVFEYFGARRPILCVPGDGSSLDALLRETRTGVPARDRASVASALAAAARARRGGTRLPWETGVARVEPHTRRARAGDLARILDGIALPAPAAPARARGPQEVGAP
ncbi:MAG: hypothetical protein L6R43_01920 [Planctomycetes bacterium]|nr:hypothetical protein [Planctomycetota bacterium]